MSLKRSDMKIKATDTTYTKKAEKAQKKAQNKAQKKDILHDTPVRYLGYCDDIGAATRVVCSNSKNALIKNLPAISYIPVAAYISADVLSTYSKAKKEDGKEMAKKKALSQGVFQGITSILFPIGIVGAAQKGAGKMFDKFIPALKQNIAENGAKIVNHKRDVALAVIGLGALIAVSEHVDKFAKNILMKKIINPIIGIKENKTECAQETSNDTPKGDEHLIGTTQG